MTFLDSPKNFERWIAGIQSDYELVLWQFLITDSWTYQTFKDCVKKWNTIIRKVVGKGKTTTEHFLLVTDVLIRTAKDSWLKDPMTKLLEKLHNDQEPTFWMESLSSVKRMLGGFYLLYTMYTTIPFKDPNGFYKIPLDSRDIVCFYYFRLVLVNKEEIPLFVKKQFVFLFGNLALDGAFDMVPEAEQKGVNELTRVYENNTRSTIAELNNEYLTSKVELIGPDLHKIQKNVRKMEDIKMVLNKKMIQSSGGLSKYIMDPSSTSSLDFPINEQVKVELGLPLFLPPCSNSTYQPETSERLVPMVVDAVAQTYLMFEEPVWTVDSSLATRTGGREMMADALERANGNTIGRRSTNDEQSLETRSLWRETDDSGENRTKSKMEMTDVWAYLKNGKFGASSATNTKQ